MPTVIWSPHLETGDPMVDRQHQNLFEMVEALHGALLAGKGPDVLGPLLAQMASYSLLHFHTEEELMLRARYPNYLRHKGKHEALASRVKDLQEALAQGTALPADLGGFLGDWVAHHIEEEDFEWITWVRDRS